MFVRTAAILGAVFFALLILIVSVIRFSSPRYAFYEPPSPTTQPVFSTNVGYYFPSPGIGPDSPFWFAKALRDKVWLAGTFSSQKRSLLLLLFADKRVVMSENLMKEGRGALAVTTAQKAEQYLEDSYNEALMAEMDGEDISELLSTLAKASLRHRETIEYETTIAPKDAIPTLNKISDTPKAVYEDCIQKLIQKGKPIPIPQEKILLN
jgi:hypothetical protein